MATRVVHFNSATARTETTSSTYADKVALTFTPDDNSTYALLWSCVADVGSIATDIGVRLQHDTASTTLCETLNESKDVSDLTSHGGVAYATFGASPGSQTFSIEFATEGTAFGLQQAYLIAIKLTANDKFATASATSTTSTSPQTVATITWTPGSTGDYIILASAGAASDSASQAAIQLFDGTTTYAACSPLSHDNDVDLRQPWFHAVYASGLSGSQTWSVRYNAVSSGTINISNSFIVALRVDDWPAVYQAADRARTTTTSASFVDRTTLTQTTEAGDHVEIAVSVLDRATTTNSLEWQLTRDAATVGVSYLREEELNSAHVPGYMALVSTLSAASHTWKTQFRGESGSTETGIADSAIIVLQIVQAAGDIEAQPTPGTLGLVGLAPTVSAGVTLAPSQGTIAITGHAATFSADVDALPASGTVGIVGAAPTISASSTTEPGQGALAVTGVAPAVSAGATVELSAGAITVTGLAPTVDVAGNVTADPQTGSLTVSGLAPDVLGSASLTPDAGTVVVSGLAPAIEASAVLAPAAGAVVVTGFAPVASVIQRQLPDAVLATSNLKDTLTNIPPTRLADIDESPDADDTEWWTAVDPALDTAARVGFATPQGTLFGTQQIRVLVRGTSLPARNVRVELWENGAKLTSEQTDSVTSDSGQVVTLTFQANEVTDPADVEVRVLSVAA